HYVSVKGVYSMQSVQQVDPEFKSFREREGLPHLGENAVPLRVDPNQMILVVRTTFDKDGADDDWLFRFSPGSVRLVANRKNYVPLGTLEDAQVLYNNKLDDFLFVDLSKANAGADFVFAV